MKEETKRERFRHDAKGIVDMLFDAKLFKEHLTREELVNIEDYITFSMDTSFDSHQRIDALVKRIEDRKIQTQ